MATAATDGTEDLDGLAAEFLRRNGERLLQGLTAQNSFFTAGQVPDYLVQQRDWQPPEISARLASSGALRRAITDNLLTDMSRVMEFEAAAFDPAADSNAPNRFTTVELQGKERQIIRTAVRWSKERGAGTDAATANTAIEGYSADREAAGKDPKVDEEVRVAARKMLEKVRFGMLIGPPGAGKTTLINIVGRALKSTGQSILITTESGMLSQKLEHETGHQAMPLSEVMAQLERVRNLDAAPELGLKRGGMLILDEAAMLGTRRKFELMQLCNKHGLSLREVGDPKQIAALEPGSPMQKQMDFVEPAVLNRIMRQRDPIDKEATLDMHAGDTLKALQSYARRDRIKFCENADEAIADAARDYAKWRAKDKHDGKSSAVLALNHDAAEQINALARQHLKEAGYLGGGIQVQTAYGQKEFSVRDRIVFRERLDLKGVDANHRIYKGSVATVLETGRDSLTIELDGKPGAITVPMQKGIRATHAHAIELTQPDPAESPQGSTLTRGFLAVTGPWTAPEALVGMTRQKKKLTVYVNREVYPDLERLAEDASKRPERLSVLDVEDRPRPAVSGTDRPRPAIPGG